MPPPAVSEPPASAVAGQLEAIEDQLANIAPEWLLVLKKAPGRKPADYPQAVLGKGGRSVKLNDHAVRLLAGLGGTQAPPAALEVRVFVDAKHQLVGFSRAEKEDAAAFTMQRAKKSSGPPTWSVRICGAIADTGIQVPALIRRRMRAFGNRVYGFHFGPEAQP